MPYLSASAVVIHYEEALYQVYALLPLPLLTYLGLVSLRRSVCDCYTDADGDSESVGRRR